MNGRTRTFLDANVLIAAFRGKNDIARRAFAIIDDPNREFVSSDFLRLELVPKPEYNRKQEEVDFYTAYFSRTVAHGIAGFQVVREAQVTAEKFGLGGFDALHAVTAKALGATEFVTNEATTKPLFRINFVTVTPL